MNKNGLAIATTSGIGNERRRQPTSWPRGIAGCIVAAVTLVACSNNGGADNNTNSTRSASAPPSNDPSSQASPPGGPAEVAKPLRLVALGDSIIYGSECPACGLFVDQFANALSKKTGEKVEVSNLAVPGAEVSDLLDLVRSDEPVRDALGGANAVVVTIGHNDLPYNRLDDPCHVAAHYPVVEWSEITNACTDRVTDQYRQDLDAALAEIDRLSKRTPTLLRVTTVYNSALGDHVDPSWDSPDAVEPSVYATERYAEAQCEVAKDHGGECADTYHALNGQAGRDAAGEFLGPDYTHLSQEGHDAFAQALISTGFQPLIQRSVPWIAYQAFSESGDGDGIFLIRSDGTEQHQILTNVAGEQIHPDWSPTGAELAFVVVNGDAQEVWVSDGDGSHARRAAACVGRCLEYDYVAWAPPGRRLLMMRYDKPTVGTAGVPASSTLELLDLQSGSRRDVVTSASQELFSAPEVSPDGSRYCVTIEIGDTGNGPTGSVVAVGKLNGGSARRLTNPHQFGSYCDWRQSRPHIVFTAYDLSIFDDMSVPSNLYTISPDGSRFQRITDFKAGRTRATQPRWTPDDTRILFTRVDGDGSYVNRRMASISATGQDVEWATGEQSMIGTHPTLQP